MKKSNYQSPKYKITLLGEQDIVTASTYVEWSWNFDDGSDDYIFG